MDTIQTDLVVLGAGPGGYAAAFYAAQKGKKVLLVDENQRLGGVCLNHGCIPSKALLHVAQLITEAKASRLRGVTFGPPQIELGKLRDWKEGILETLGNGIQYIGKQRGVKVLHGRGQLQDLRRLRVETAEGPRVIAYEHAVIAVGSKPAMPPPFDLKDPRVMTSTEALQLDEIPKRLLVVGGGYIGMELGTVYASLGSQVVLVEALHAILTGTDPDLIRPVVRCAEQQFHEIRVNTTVRNLSPAGSQVEVTMETNGKALTERYDRVLVAVGRVPNCSDIGLEHTKVTRDEQGFIHVNAQQQTSDPAVLAIGDVAGGALLAHKARKEGRIAVEAISGEASAFEDIVMPAVVYTDPEVAWCGLTESEANAQERDIRVVKFTWRASGRAVSLARPDGLTKLIIDPGSERVLGVGIVGVGAGELISEGVLAVQMGITAKVLACTVHPHPTLSETLMECAEAFYGGATHTEASNR